MTFDEWWSSQGCRQECLTHEDRARAAWDACAEILNDEIEQLEYELLDERGFVDSWDL